MTRLAVVSRNAALPFALNSAGHEVVVVDDEADVRWAEYSSAEIVVLDLDDPVASQLLVDDLAYSSLAEVRVLLLASKNPGWAEALAQVRPGVAVLPLPLSLHRLNQALDTLAHGAPLVHSQRPALVTTPPPLRESAPEPELDPQDASDPLDEGWAPEPEPLEQPEPELLSEPELLPEPETPQRPEPEPVAQPAIGAASMMPATVGYYEVRASPAPEPPQEVTPVALPRAVPAPSEPVPVVTPPPPRAVSLVRALSACVDDLASVGDTCSVTCSEARRKVPADAAAVLVRDGARWRVGGGTDLRPLEHRLVIESDHWLVRQVSVSTYGIILAGGEGRWSELYGVPLSGRAHLLAAPMLPVGAILLLARDEGEFVEADLMSLTELCEEGGHLLADAVDVRRLARQLTAFLDSDE